MVVVKVINTRDNTFPHNYFITKTNLVFITVLGVTTGMVIIRFRKILRGGQSYIYKVIILWTGNAFLQ